MPDQRTLVRRECRASREYETETDHCPPPPRPWRRRRGARGAVGDVAPETTNADHGLVGLAREIERRAEVRAHAPGATAAAGRTTAAADREIFDAKIQGERHRAAECARSEHRRRAGCGVERHRGAAERAGQRGRLGMGARRGRRDHPEGQQHDDAGVRRGTGPSRGLPVDNVHGKVHGKTPGDFTHRAVEKSRIYPSASSYVAPRFPANTN